jgi:hypothetical protein
VPEEESRMATMAVAVQAYLKEYKGSACPEEDTSKWRSVARTEALR